MCKKVNRLFPILMLFYIGGSYLISYLLHGRSMPIWFSLIESQLLILVPVILFVLYEKINVAKCLPYKLLKPLDALLALLFGYSLIPMMILLNYVSMLFSTNKIQEATGALMEYPFLVQIFFLAVIPAFVEEFVFRGIFYHSYRKNGILGAALLSGFIFGIMHLNINQFVYAFVLGVIFALLVEATGSMLTSMIAHFAINTYSIIIMQLVPDSMKNSENANSIIQSMTLQTTIMTICVLAVVASAFGIISFVIYKNLAKRNNRWNYITGEIRKGIKPQNDEKFATIPLIVTLLLCVGFMIYTEYFI
ncbi:CPBP family intramembrane glutamic endopeptidase [[Clostridium] fimetarium]|uniref:CAAX prenyl protease 2/Lysostaphin resistance protein A-like domain-containing protein n=1 Tax=[Clostridium] fimetarium TaxID=99656 RepID=A0A1I0M6A5_9FIRM|nr:type II CAAX endopeptidase family protein [[Clostridium] fimetarium]SEV82891.1 hypothetical protein SAMN05421659_101150 [[Clostridium] fimetarium]